MAAAAPCAGSTMSICWRATSASIRDFLPKALGSRVTEQIVLDSGEVGGCWFTVNNKSYDIAYTRDYTGSTGRFHHVTYAVDQREHVLEAADIFLENGVHIETGPHKHAVQQTFFLYVYEPAGNRVEIANAGARLILDPDWETVTWTETERKKGQAWGLKTIESFHTHGTPPVQTGASLTDGAGCADGRSQQRAQLFLLDLAGRGHRQGGDEPDFRHLVGRHALAAPGGERSRVEPGASSAPAR